AVPLSGQVVGANECWGDHASAHRRGHGDRLAGRQPACPEWRYQVKPFFKGDQCLGVVEMSIGARCQRDDFTPCLRSRITGLADMDGRTDATWSAMCLRPSQQLIVRPGRGWGFALLVHRLSPTRRVESKQTDRSRKNAVRGEPRE